MQTPDAPQKNDLLASCHIKETVIDIMTIVKFPIIDLESAFQYSVSI